MNVNVDADNYILNYSIYISDKNDREVMMEYLTNLKYYPLNMMMYYTDYDNILFIRRINVAKDKRKRGIGKKAIELLIKDHPNDLIFMLSSPDSLEFPHLMGGRRNGKREEIKKVVEGASAFISKCGFTCADDLFLPEDSIYNSFFIYPNEVGIQCMERRKNDISYYKAMDTLKEQYKKDIESLKNMYKPIFHPND